MKFSVYQGKRTPMQRTLLLTMATVIVVWSVNAQQISNVAINTLGGQFENSSINVSLTVGELIVGEIKNDKFSLSGGSVQPVLIITGSNREMRPTVFIYPNPVSETIMIESDVVIIKVKVLSSTGILVHVHNVRGQESTFDVSSIPDGFYVVVLETLDHQISQHKLLKKSRL